MYNHDIWWLHKDYRVCEFEDAWHKDMIFLFIELMMNGNKEVCLTFIELFDRLSHWSLSRHFKPVGRTKISQVKTHTMDDIVLHISYSYRWTSCDDDITNGISPCEISMSRFSKDNKGAQSIVPDSKHGKTSPRKSKNSPTTRRYLIENLQDAFNLFDHENFLVDHDHGR